MKKKNIRSNKKKIKNTKVYILQIILFLVFILTFIKFAVLPPMKNHYQQLAIQKQKEQEIKDKIKWKEDATAILNVPHTDLQKQYTQTTPLAPISNYTIPNFPNMPKDFNIVLQTIKPGKMTRDEAMKAVNEKAGKELYGKRSGKNEYYEMYDGAGLGFIDQDGDDIPIGSFSIEYDKKEVIRKVYFETMSRYLKIYITPADAYKYLGKPDKITYSPSKYPGTEYVYSSKGITFIGYGLGPWAEGNDPVIIPDMPIYSLVLYESCTYEDYVKNYTEMTPFYEEFFL